MKDNRKKMISALYITVIALVIFAAASFAWMSYSSTPTVSELDLSVITDDALEIAPDVDGTPGVWSSILDLSDLSGELRPITFSAEEYSFLIADYGIDGRVDFSSPIRLMELSKYNESRGNFTAADAELLADYIIIYDFWLKCDASSCSVVLSPPVYRTETELGSGTFVIGEPVWDESTFLHKETGSGAENAIRIGFLVESSESDPTDHFVIYEPNADTHGDDAITYSTDDGGGALEGSYKLIRQRKSVWSECDPVLKDSVVYSVGDFMSENCSLFKLTAGEMRHITMFIWLEGQDADCRNSISRGRVFSNIQFGADQNDDDNPIRPE